MHLRPVFCGVAFTAIGFGVAAAQSQAAFDVASIKPAKPDSRGYSIRPLPNGLSAQNVTLKQLVAEAYHAFDFEVSGPKWMESDRYDIEAKTGLDVPADGKLLQTMLQKLLADRFAVRIRREPKEMTVYVLEPGKGDLKIEKGKNPGAPVGFRVFQRRQITSENAPLERLTEALTWLLGKPVEDRTGLTGGFDYKLEWSPDEVQLRSQETTVDSEGNGLSLAAAIQAQLGLRLTSKKDTVDLIVVENAEHPAVN